MNILITGGAGYIGSTVAWMFIDRGHKVTIIDNLKNGNLSNIPKKSKFIKSDIANIKKLEKNLDKKYDVVLHFAALIDNQESLIKKKEYLKNNFYKSKIFFQFCLKRGIRKFIFSSSAAVYGNSNTIVNEKSKTEPLAPYGLSKLRFENFLRKLDNKIDYVILRYFNVVGAEKKLRCGFKIKKNKSIFSNLCQAFFNNKIFHIYGKNFSTHDGTSVRDYIYISDLSEVHYNFAKKILKTKLRLTLNCGYGKGYSVLSVIQKLNLLKKKKIKYYFKPQRKNDIEYSVASTKKLEKYFQFKNLKSKLEIMINSSLLWYKKNKIN
tara:strand:+ start:5609 stop:6574 length:966 start_codon:yes stop_codon:yes gene_type:complete